MSSRPIVYKYPKDRTGINPNNLIIGEPHTLSGTANRVVVPNYGAFFTESLVVRDSNGQVLSPRDQYVAAQLYQEATEETGKEICAVIVITDTAIENNVTIEYQVLGGEFSYSVEAIREAVQSLELDYRPVQWGDLIGKPSLFAPSPHLHSAGDVYGFEYVVEALESVRDSIMAGTEPYVDELKQYADHLHQEISERVEEIKRTVDDVNEKADFFDGTKATKADVLKGQRDDVFVTPKTYISATNYLIKNYQLLLHHEGKRNAHNLTKEDIGIYLDEGMSVYQARQLIQSEVPWN